MTGTLAPAKPDVDLTDGNFFYADGGAREAYRWMRANEPVFRDRNGLAAAASYQAVIDAERDPETFSNTGGIRPDNPGMPYMIDMDDPGHLLRRKLVNAGFTRKRVMDKVAGIDTLCDTLIDAVCERGGSVISSATSPRRCPWPSSATCWACCPKSARHC